MFESSGGFGYDETKRKVSEVSPEERDRVFEELWNIGSGFRFLFGGFSDLTTDEASNQAAIDFIHNKIRKIVKDDKVSRTASLLVPRRSLPAPKWLADCTLTPV